MHVWTVARAKISGTTYYLTRLYGVIGVNKLDIPARFCVYAEKYVGVLRVWRGCSSVLQRTGEAEVDLGEVNAAYYTVDPNYVSVSVEKVYMGVGSCYSNYSPGQFVVVVAQCLSSEGTCRTFLSPSENYARYDDLFVMRTKYAVYGVDADSWPKICVYMSNSSFWAWFIKLNKSQIGLPYTTCTYLSTDGQSVLPGTKTCRSNSSNTWDGLLYPIDITALNLT